jgi:phosphoribosyl 1,2-cyclic phosphodiesterase
VLARKLNVPIFMTGATHQVWARGVRDAVGERPHVAKLEMFCSGQKFQIGDIAVTPFTIPHDAADPVGFTFRSEGIKIGFVTDLGYIPASVRDHLRGCDVLILESNHDLEMLRVGPYPWSVKQRVMSRVGHLSNEALAEFFASDYDGGATYVVLAHLSEHNNHPELARGAAEKALAPRRTLLHNRVLLAAQSEPLEAIRL